MSTSNKKTCLFVYLLEKVEIAARTSVILTKTPALLHISLIGPPKIPTFMLHIVLGRWKKKASVPSRDQERHVPVSPASHTAHQGSVWHCVWVKILLCQ